MHIRSVVWLALISCGTVHAGSIRRAIIVGQHERSYSLYVPASADEHAPAALVIVFHGGNGRGRTMAQLAQFDRIADREGFLVAYPDGLRGHWRDGREMPRGLLAEGADDVAFVAALLEDAAKFRKLDPHRIFATGISNGGIFSHYLALKMSDRIAAIGVVAGGIATQVAQDFKPTGAVSVLIMHGRADPIVPYAGGAIAFGHGSIVSTEAASGIWRNVDGLRGEPQRQRKPAKTANDCGEEWQSWTGGRNNSALTFIALDGGGHTWPGAKSMLTAIVGKTCPELDATRAIWDFFKQHPKP